MSKSEGIGQWLVTRHVGASSKALAAATLGALASGAPDYPHDVDDFGRCRFLWSLAPSASEGLALLASVSAPWNRLAERWDELINLYDTDRKACDDLVRNLVDPNRRPGLRIIENRRGPDGRWDQFDATEAKP